MMDDRQRAQVEALPDRVLDYVRRYPKYYGIAIQAVSMTSSGMPLLRGLLGLLKREIVSWRIRRPKLVPQPLGGVVIDATWGGRHSILWAPVARDLARGGIGVGLLSFTGEWRPGSPLERELSLSPLVTSISAPGLLRGQQGRLGRPPARSSSTNHWSGVYRVAIVLMERWIDRMVEAWGAVLRESPIRVFVTTAPCGGSASALIHACHLRGVPTAFIQQGLPGPFHVPSTRTAIVWTDLGRALLMRNGWRDTAIKIARNPTLPAARVLDERRAERRKALSLDEGVRCVLFLGQMSKDVVETKGYVETCRLVARGLAMAATDKSIVPVFRPHPTERTNETERVLRGEAILGLRVSRRSPLMDDIAAADVVVGMHSTAMEEAYLAGRHVVQVVGTEPTTIDFRTLGASKASTAEELANRLTDATRSVVSLPSRVPAVADVILDIMGKGETERQ